MLRTAGITLRDIDLLMTCELLATSAPPHLDEVTALLAGLSDHQLRCLADAADHIRHAAAGNSC
jgi:hypothetical protein